VPLTGSIGGVFAIVAPRRQAICYITDIWHNQTVLTKQETRVTVRTVLKMGDPRLLQVSAPVEPIDVHKLELLLTDMWDTMAAENGAGLAAPQIGVLQRVVIFGCETNPRYPDAPAVPETVLINPLITPLDDSTEDGWEGCLSVPGLRGMVTRFSNIRYQGFDQFGKTIDREATGFHARVVQHECDHLDGVLYPQRMTDMRQFGYLDSLSENDLIRLQPCDDDA
jgi:peptide deformylase